MSIPMTSAEILEREFFEIRAKILEIAAAFDRLDRATGNVSDDSRLKLVEEALRVLQQVGREDRAEQVQLIFSREYNDQWQAEFGISSKDAATSSNG
ncbi:MAG: hypothetical protein VB877_10625 [Pirellulaceae bacterium]